MAKNKNRREVNSPAVTVTEKIPLVSVIIPMYNAANFIPQTLESLLNQTMTDFEVVAVDDCSTDKSVEVVENFAERFDGRLHVVKLAKNTGTPGLPRNVGIQMARGKYIAFLDSDDLYTKTALEELSTLAENFQAEVVHSDTFYLSEDDKVTVCRLQKLPVVSEPTFETKDLAQRIRYWVKRGYNWEPYTMFCRRDFLVRNQIQFPKMRSYGDMLFSFAVLCQTEKFLRVPNLTYIYKKRQGSVSYENRDDIPARFRKYAKVMNDGFNAYEKIMDEIKFFAEHPDYRYAVLDFYMNDVLYSTQPYYAKKPPFEFNEFIKEAFHPDDAALAAHLFNTVNIWRSQLMRLQQEKLNGKK